MISDFWSLVSVISRAQGYQTTSAHSPVCAGQRLARGIRSAAPDDVARRPAGRRRRSPPRALGGLETLSSRAAAPRTPRTSGVRRGVRRTRAGRPRHAGGSRPKVGFVPTSIAQATARLVRSSPSRRRCPAGSGSRGPSATRFARREPEFLPPPAPLTTVPSRTRPPPSSPRGGQSRSRRRRARRGSRTRTRGARRSSSSSTRSAANPGARVRRATRRSAVPTARVTEGEVGAHRRSAPAWSPPTSTSDTNRSRRSATERRDELDTRRVDPGLDQRGLPVDRRQQTGLPAGEHLSADGDRR